MLSYQKVKLNLEPCCKSITWPHLFSFTLISLSPNKKKYLINFSKFHTNVLEFSSLKCYLIFCNSWHYNIYNAQYVADTLISHIHHVDMIKKVHDTNKTILQINQKNFFEHVHSEHVASKNMSYFCKVLWHNLTFSFDIHGCPSVVL